MLIVENGTVVADANTYIDRAFYIAYAASRGSVVISDAAADVDIIKGMDYLETQRFIGERLYDGLPAMYAPIDAAIAEQPCAWPRKGIYHCDDQPTALHIIPHNLKRAQAQVALDVHNGFNPFVNVAAGKVVISEKVGPISRAYAEGRSVPLMPIANGLLRGLVVMPGTVYRL